MTISFEDRELQDKGWAPRGSLERCAQSTNTGSSSPTTLIHNEIWLEGFKKAVIQYEDHKEDKHIRRGKRESSGTSSSRRDKNKKPPRNSTRPLKRYTKQKMAVYKASIGKPKTPGKKEWSKEKIVTTKKR